MTAIARAVTGSDAQEAWTVELDARRGDGDDRMSRDQANRAAEAERGAGGICAPPSSGTSWRSPLR